MKDKLSNPYAGPLSAGEIAAGMNAALRNARRLLYDAQLLFAAHRFPSACSLAILSIEESGKLPVLREIGVARDADEAKGAWKRYRTHQAKNVAWIIRDLIKP